MSDNDQWIIYGLRFSILFCWFFSFMVAITTLGSQNISEILLKGVVVGVGAWCGWGILKRRRHVILFSIGLCFYALFGSAVWLYYSTIIPLMYGQQIVIGWYDGLAMFYIVCGAIIIKLLTNESVKRKFTR